MNATSLLLTFNHFPWPLGPKLLDSFQPSGPGPWPLALTMSLSPPSVWNTISSLGRATVIHPLHLDFVDLFLPHLLHT